MEMKKDKPKVNDQENIQRINKENNIENVLLHQVCSEMLGLKREIDDLKAEVKLNELRSQDEIKDAYDNIKLLKNQVQILTLENRLNKKEVKQLQEFTYGTTKQNMTDKEAAILGLNRMLFGDKDEKV